MTSTLERTFEYTVRALAPELLIGMEAQHPVGPGRKFRLDYAWPAARVAVELEGGLWSRGAHSRPVGILRDIDKGNFAVLHGWRVLRFSTQHIEDDPGAVIAQLRALLTQENAS